MDREVMSALDALGEANKTFHARFDERHAQLEKRLEDRMDDLETRFQRPPMPGGSSDDFGRPIGSGKNSPAYQSFIKALRYGTDHLDLHERKAVLQIGDDAKGGYLAPPEFANEILTNLVQYSPIRGLARVMNTTASSVAIPKRTATGTAAWVGELEQRPTTQPTYGMENIPINTMAAVYEVGSAMLEDSVSGFAEDLSNGLAQEFGRLEGNSLLWGDAVKKPQGVFMDQRITTVPSGNATGISADSIIDMFYSLPAYFRNRSTWVCSGTCLAAIRRLKTGDGQFLWVPGLGPEPERILGRPVVEAVDAPDVGAGAKPLILGDWKSGYRIADRLNFTILVDRYTQAEFGKVRFHARRRVGAQVVMPECFRIMVVSAG